MTTTHRITTGTVLALAAARATAHNAGFNCADAGICAAGAIALSIAGLGGARAASQHRTATPQPWPADPRRPVPRRWVKALPPVPVDEAARDIEVVLSADGLDAGDAVDELLEFTGGQAPTGSRVANERRIARSTLPDALERLVADGQAMSDATTRADDVRARPLFSEWLRRR